MNKFLSSISLLLALGLCLVACGGTSKRIDPNEDDEIGGGGIESQDVLAMADKFSRDLLSWGPLFQTGYTPVIYVTEFKNESSTHIDKKIVLEKIETSVLRNGQGRLKWIDRSKEGMDAILQERAAKRDGTVSGNSKEALKGADFVMKGSIRSIDKRRDDMRSTYYQITAELTNLESGEKIWKNDYEFKWMGDKSAIYQ